MVLILHDDERIAPGLLAGHVPGRGGGSGAAAYLKAGPLAQGVQGETAMLAYDQPGVGFDGAGFHLKITAQEFLKRPLADEADAGAVRLVIHRQSRRMRQAPYLRLAQLPDRKQGLAERRGGNAVEKITLILGRVRGLEQLRSCLRMPQARIVAG